MRASSIPQQAVPDRAEPGAEDAAPASVPAVAVPAADIPAADIPATVVRTDSAPASAAPASASPVSATPGSAPAFDLHVLQVLPSLESGGVERGTVDVAAAVVKAGGRATVVSAGGPMVRELEKAGARHIEMDVDSKHAFDLWRNSRALLRLIRKEGVDIVHARSRAPAWSARRAARRAGVPFVTTFHGTYNFKGWFKKRYNAVMTMGDRVIAISAFIAQHIRENYRLPAERIEVIHRGVDVDIFVPHAVPVARIQTLAELWRLPDGVPVVMLPGRLTRWKGQTIFLDALAKLPDLEFMGVLVGGDQGREAYREELEDQIRALGLGGRVRLVGDTKDMAAAYMLADVVVSASTDPEAFGRTIVEAQAMGRPVIAPKHGAAPETVLDGITGWLIKPGDAEALAAGIRATLELTGDQRRQVAEAAQRNVRTHFSKETMCRKTLALYQKLAIEKGRRPPPA
ncbi:MAG: glycosyltransferase family 4 protein [Rhodospirillaceae bacterium]|nr:glycosyltransferase family 4 protein [Rhodospirillaceae bacterium]